MTFERTTILKFGQRSAMATALGLVLATAACSGSDTDEADAAAPVGSGERADATSAAANASQASGEMTIDGETFAFTTVYWCPPEPGYEDGTTVAMRIMATDDGNDASIYAMQVDEDGSGASQRTLQVATDRTTNFSSEGLDDAPTIIVEDENVRLRGRVYRPGRDPVEVEAEFSLPAAPGFPGYC